MRRTDQYAQWQRLRQKNDVKAQKLAPILLARDALLQNAAQGKPINWQEFDRLTAQANQFGLTLPNSEEVQTEAQAQPPSPSSVETATASAVPAATLLNEENMLVLGLVSRSIGLKQEIVAYGDEQTTLLPLGEVAQALDFSLSVDTRQKTATGWFISEDRSFFLDADRQTIEIDGRTYPWNDSAIAVGEDDIFVDSKTLSEWLPVDFAISTGEMTATVTPREQLPIQARYEREKKRQGLGQHEDTGVKYDIIPSPYERFSFPVMDMAATSGIKKSNRDKAELKLNHSIVAEGDLAYMGAKAYLSGHEENPVNNARITLERLDPSANLLGSMHASQIAIGDISPADFPIIGSGVTARGLSISNADIQRSRDFDTTRFEGNMQPGWDVELYQNGNLINSVRVGSDGRYLFEDIPVYFGNNAFQVVALGPQGQRRIAETKNINVGSGMLKAGGFEYNLSATQAKSTLAGIDNQITDGYESGRLTSSFAYGVTDYLSATTGLSSIEYNDTWHHYVQAGLNGTFSSLYGEVNAIQDIDGGSAFSVQGQTALGPFNLRAKHEIFNAFTDPGRPDDLLRSRTSAGINGLTPRLFFLPPISYTLSRDNTVFDDRESGRTNFRVAGHAGRIHLANVIHWNDSAATSSSMADVDGEFQATGNIGRGRIVAGLDYDLEDKSEISQYKISGTYPLAEKITAGANLLRREGDIEGTTAEVNLAFDTGTMILSPKLSYDDEGNYSALLSVSFSLGEDPVSKELKMQSEKRAGKGAATALVYHDANNNKVFDQDDTPLPEVKVVARQFRKKGETNDQGVASLTNLSAFTPTDVEIDTKSLADPFWQPSVPGVAIMPRSASVQRVELPVVTTGEIEGTIFAKNNKGEKVPLSNVHLELRDRQGSMVKATASEYDGFYLFEKVLPGSYTLHIVGDDPQIKALAGDSGKEVIIGNDGTIARGMDIVLGSPDAEAPGENDRVPETLPPEKALKERNIAGAAPIAQVTSPSPAAAAQPPGHSTPEATVAPLKATPKQKISASLATPPAASAPSAAISLAPLRVETGPALSPEAVQTDNPSDQPDIPAKTIAPSPADSHSGRPVASLAEHHHSPPTESADTANQDSSTAAAPSSASISLTPLQVISGSVQSPGAPSAPPFDGHQRTVTGGQADRSVARPPDAPTAGSSTKSSETNGGRKMAFTVQLASYQSMKAAQAGVQILAKRLDGIVAAEDFIVTGVNLGQRGIFYRVTCGRFDSRRDADRLAERMLPRTDNAFSILTRLGSMDDKPVRAQPPLRTQTGLNPAEVAAKYATMQQRR